MSISLILASYHTGIQSFRVGAGPDAIVAHGLVARLEALGFTVTAHTIPPVDSYEGRDWTELRSDSSRLSCSHRSRGQ